MTADPATDVRETDPGPTARALRPFDAAGPVIAIPGAVALAFVVVARGVTVLGNTPFDPAAASPAVRTATGVAALAGVVATLVALSAADDRATVRVGLLFAAVFGCLPLVAPGTTLLAVVAVTGGGTLALVGTLGVPTAWTPRAVRRRLVALGLVAGVGLTLCGVTGLVDGLRNSGAFVTLAAITAVGAWAGRSWLAAAAGILAVGAVVLAGAVSPFVLGSALLVGFAVTGVPTLVTALAVGGGVAAIVAGLSRREYTLAVGATLVVFAGIPATFPRALTLLAGAAMVVLDWGEPKGVTA